MRPTVEIVVPVHNEQLTLQPSLRELHAFVRRSLPDLDVRITIADNGSTDLTGALAMQLLDELPELRLQQLSEKGRGRALRSAWSASTADIVAYMDVDLSTDLAALGGLLRPLVRDQADIAIGSRLAPGADVRRSFKRELISRSYNRLLQRLLGVRFADAQCGFKAARRAAILPLLDRVQNQSWFFDTELLYLAERERLRILELPVRWLEDRESSVRIPATALENLREIWRLRRAGRRPWPGQAAVNPPAGPAAAPAAPRTPDRREAGAGTTPC